MNQKRNANLYYITIFLGVIAGIALDQYTKMQAVNHLKGQASYSVIKNVFSLEYLENRGAAFGLLQNQQIVFAVSAGLFLILALYCFVKLPKTKRYMPLFVLGTLIIAGAAGNMIDRVRLGYVVDFFYFELINFPVFNVADIYVTVSFAILIFFLFFYYREEELECLKFSRTSMKEDED